VTDDNQVGSGKNPTSRVQVGGKTVYGGTLGLCRMCSPSICVCGTLKESRRKTTSVRISKAHNI